MTVVYFPLGRPVVNETMPDETQHRREIARSLNLVMSGRDNSSMSLTLDGATTTVIDPRISVQTAITLMPTSAAAAAALPSLWIVCTKGEAIINGGSAGLTYTMAIRG